MPKARKPAARKPLAPKNSNIPPSDASQQQLDSIQSLRDANFREFERRVAAIRAVGDAELEGFLSQLRVARSLLSEEVQAMRLRDFVKKFCPDREPVISENGFIELKHKKAGFDCPSITSSFEFQREQLGSALNSCVLPTPTGFPFFGSSAKEQLPQSVDKYIENELEEDEEFLKMMDAFKDSKPGQSGPFTPSGDGQLKVGLTPKTERLPRKGEPLLSMNGSPLGIFGKDGITRIPEERPRNTRRRLRASATNDQF